MKKMLKKSENKCWYFVDGTRTDGTPPDLRGDVSCLCGDVSGLWGYVSDLWGNASGIRGNVSYLWGNASGLRGDVSGIRGNVSGIRGDVSDCEISEESRKNGVDVSELIAGDDQQ